MQRLQQLPSLQKARAAAQPPSPTATALQKLGRRPPCPASPGLAAVQQAVGGVSSLSALSTLQDGLDSGLGASAPAAGAPQLDAGRLTWQAKRQAATAVCVDQVYGQIQASRKGRGLGRRGRWPWPWLPALLEAKRACLPL